VDHIGSVILSPDQWRLPILRDVVRLTRGSKAKSTLIPLIGKVDDILRALDYYQPDLVHFCELIPMAPHDRTRQDEIFSQLIEIQRVVKKEFPPIGIVRSIPIPTPGLAEAEPVREAILKITGALSETSDFFMSDTLYGYNDPKAAQPVNGYVGITGEVCDWDLVAWLVEATRTPVILAGGISPDNVADAIGRVKPAGIDSCMQTNARDSRGKPIRFRKDMDRVRRLLDEVRRAEER
jgi:phosphoribosylanthranilate isomerase